jgi:ribonucleoside-diphosphate reductase alpha chain
MRDAAYAASATGAGARRLPAVQCRPVPERHLRLAPAAALRERIRSHGLRNSHLLSIAPTGTISLAFADNASNGIEPAFSWSYKRKKRMPDGSFKEYAVEDHAWRLYRHLKGGPCAADAGLRHRAGDERTGPCRHGGRGGALHRHRHLQDRQRAGRLPLRRLPGPVPAGLAVRAQGPGHLPAQQRAGLGAQRHAARGQCRRRCASPTPTAAWRWSACRRRCCRRCAGRAGPTCRRATRPGPSWCTTRSATSRCSSANWRPKKAVRRSPFEVWVNGAEQPRGLGALAKTLSMDLRANDPAWLQLKLDALATVAEERAFEMPSRRRRDAPFPGVVAATAAVIRWRCEQLGQGAGQTAQSRATPVIDAMFSRDEPHTGPAARWPGRWTWTTRPPARPSR